MLVLSRKLNEKIKIGNDITVTVVQLLEDRVRLGIEAPATVKVLRGELLRERPSSKERNNHGLERPAR